MAKTMQKRIVDTNIPITANLARSPEKIPDQLVECVLACVKAIEEVTSRNVGIVIDVGDEIYNEYRNKLSLSGAPGVGDKFLKWVHDNRWSLPEEDRVFITLSGDTYLEFPIHDGLKAFDRSDRKFVAVANAHCSKPPILQGTDSKWWGWKKTLAEAGITVQFLCEGYVKEKYAKKIGS